MAIGGQDKLENKKHSIYSLGLQYDFILVEVK